MAKRIAQRLLLLGWDAADWQVIHQLLERGEMPHLEKLINQGVMGNLSTLQPVLSPMLWTSIATGKRADKHGIYGFTEPKPDGSGVRPVTCTSLQAQPLWNIIENHGLKSAVVGWFATYPASQLKGTVVSNHFHPARGRNFEDWPMPEDVCSPAELAEDLQDLRVHPDDISPDQVASFVHDLDKIDLKDERLNSLVKLLAQTFTVHAAGTHLAEHGEWDLLAVYYDAIDRLGHEFMEYRAPKMAHVSDEDFNHYKDVIDQIYRFHDLMLGRYMNLVGPETTIMIVSDHGFFSDHLRPPAREIGASKREPVRWHRDYGIFVARGPGIKQDQLVYGASLLDIAPTVLSLLGIATAKDMEGRVLSQIFEEPYKVEYIDSYGKPEMDGVSDEESDPWAAQQLMEQFVALGYVEDTSDDDSAVAIEKLVIQKLTNLAQVYLSVRDYAKAAEILEENLQRDPDDFRAKMRLAQCKLHLGDLDACRATVREILDERPRSPWGNLLAGMLCSAEGDTEKALEHFQYSEQSGPSQPQLHNRIGQIYLQQKKWQAAEEKFLTALQIDGDSAGAYRGLGIAQYWLQRYEEASESLLRSIAQLYFQPQAHFYLALSLMAMGRLEDAIRVLHVALQQKPDLPDAHRALAKIYSQREDSDRAMYHRAQADICRDVAVNAGSAA